jgi:integrase
MAGIRTEHTTKLVAPPIPAPRHTFASLAADLGYNEPTIANLLGHKMHSITSRYMHSADAVLLAAAERGNRTG